MSGNELDNVEWANPIYGSTQIDAVGENPQRPNVLYVRFIRGGTYAYDGTTPDDFTGLVNSSSPGAYLARNVKGIYPYRKLT